MLIRYSEDGENIEVGFYDPRGEWMLYAKFSITEKGRAERLLNYLNGGEGGFR